MAHRSLLLVATLACSACEPGEGYLEVSATVSSSPTTQALVRPQLRHQVGGDSDAPVHFVDGWEVYLTRYLVSVGELRIASSTGEEGATHAGFVIDLTRQDTELDTFALEARRWDAIDAEIRPPLRGMSVAAEGVLETQLMAMEQARAGYWVEGLAHHPDSGRSVTFSFPIDLSAAYLDCTNGEDGSAGIVVQRAHTSRMELNFHVEHLFYADLSGEQPMMRFEAIAAMADESGHIRWEALADQRLADLRDGAGNPLTDADGRPVTYDPAGMQLPSADLQSFVREASRTQLHLNGHGLCTLAAVD